MSDDKYEFDGDIGVQNDGEPITPADAPEAERPETEAPEGAEEQPESQEVDNDETDEEAHRKKSGAQRNKEKLQREREEKEYWKRVALEAQGKAQPATPAKVERTGEPDPEDFETHGEYLKAAVRFEAEKLLEEREKQNEQRQFKESWIQKVEAVKAELPDIEEVMSEADAPSEAVAKVITKSEHGVHLAYYLATHEDEYLKINRMEPVEAGLAMAGILSRLEGKKNEAAKQPAAQTKAPKPVSPVKTAPVPKPEGDGRLVTY